VQRLDDRDLTQKLRTCIQMGEGTTCEFKTCRNAIPKDLYTSICAFLNRSGGIILLGLSDDGEIRGIDPENISQIKKNFTTTVNNQQKINPPVYLSLDEIEIDNKKLLLTIVPESKNVHRCNGRIFDRNNDSDIDITDNTYLVTSMYQRKSDVSSENKLYSALSLSDLRKDLIQRSRKLAVLYHPGHPWQEFDDFELVKSARLLRTDPDTGKSGITLAGILLLGTDDLILSVLAHHRTDLILRKIDTERYDDRDFVSTNLIESYDRIMAFIAKHLPDPFYLEGDNRISLRDIIFRELASNCLMHREFLNPFPAKIIIEKNFVRSENSNRPHSLGLLKLNDFTPYPKNPVLASFFRQIGRADELGSGMRKLMKYGKAYGGADPQLIEGDVFQTIISIPEYSQTVRGLDSASRLGADIGTKPALSSEQFRILKLCKEPQRISVLMSEVARKDRTKFRRQLLKPLLDNNFLQMTHPDKPTSSLQKYLITEKGTAFLDAEYRKE
jgi:ATP-dependent DNA helicase RecG